MKWHCEVYWCNLIKKHALPHIYFGGILRLIRNGSFLCLKSTHAPACMHTGWRMFSNIQGRCKWKKRIMHMQNRSMTPAHYTIPCDFLSLGMAEALGMSWKLNTEVSGEAREGVQWTLSDCGRTIMECKANRDSCCKVGSAPPACVQVPVLPVLKGYQQ